MGLETKGENGPMSPSPSPAPKDTVSRWDPRLQASSTIETDCSCGLAHSLSLFAKSYSCIPII